MAGWTWAKCVTNTVTNIWPYEIQLTSIDRCCFRKISKIKESCPQGFSAKQALIISNKEYSPKILEYSERRKGSDDIIQHKQKPLNTKTVPSDERLASLGYPNWEIVSIRGLRDSMCLKDILQNEQLLSNLKHEAFSSVGKVKVQNGRAGGCSGGHHGGNTPAAPSIRSVAICRWRRAWPCIGSWCSTGYICMCSRHSSWAQAWTSPAGTSHPICRIKLETNLSCNTAKQKENVPIGSANVSINSCIEIKVTLWLWQNLQRKKSSSCHLIPVQLHQ